MGESLTGQMDETTGLQDIFGEQQSYILLSVELDEPLYPYPDSNVIKSDGKALTENYPENPKFPSTRDAISEFENAINFIVQQIGNEYSKYNQEEEKTLNQSTTSLMKQTTFLSVSALDRVTEARRQKFLSAFSQSSKYEILRNRLK